MKESIKMMNSNRSDAEKVALIKEDKKIGINEVIKYNEVINNSLKSEIRISIKMKSYCLKCRQNTENINPKVSKTNNGRTMLLSKCAICGNKKSRFIKNQEAKGPLSNLGIRTNPVGPNG